VTNTDLSSSPSFESCFKVKEVHLSVANNLGNYLGTVGDFSADFGNRGNSALGVEMTSTREGCAW